MSNIYMIRFPDKFMFQLSDLEVEDMVSQNAIPSKQVLRGTLPYVFTLDVPDSLGDYQNDTIRFIAAKLYETGKISLGQAAEMTKLSKQTFAELLSDYGVSFINYSSTDLNEELDRISGI